MVPLAFQSFLSFFSFFPPPPLPQLLLFAFSTFFSPPPSLLLPVSSSPIHPSRCCTPSLQVGLFSLGIIPYINASIVLQLMSTAFPALKKLQREEGAQGRARFQYYQKLGAFVFAIVQVRCIAREREGLISCLLSPFSLPLSSRSLTFYLCHASTTLNFHFLFFYISGSRAVDLH